MKKFRARSKPKKCPKCESTNIVEIAYGLFKGKLPEGFIAGGCVVTGDDPEWACMNCGISIWKRTGFRKFFPINI